MPEILQTNYQSISDMVQDEGAASWKKFYVIVAGRTNGAHETIVEWLRGVGHTEVFSPGDSDYLLVFCPVASRVGTDISEALQDIPAGKPVILVVMHHTFKPDHIVADSRRQVDKDNVCLTVDCLFYEGSLLTSNRNDIAWSEIQKFLGVPVFPVSAPPLGLSDNRRKWIIIIALILLAIVLIIIIPIVVSQKKDGVSGLYSPTQLSPTEDNSSLLHDHN